MSALLLVLVGLIVGVFVEGVVSSFHYDASLRPWPRCRSCGRAAPLVALVPLAGVVRAPFCRGCRRPSWLRAAQVQGATAAVFLVLGTQYAARPLLLMVSLVEAAVLVAVLFIDLELRLIPTLLIVLLVVLALGSAMFWPGLGLVSALEGGAIGFGAFALLIGLARLVFGAGALGLGDAYLALAIGCITGYPLVAYTLAFGVFLGGFGALAVLAVRRSEGLRSTIPYGPYLVLGVLYVLAHGNTVSPLIRL